MTSTRTAIRADTIRALPTAFAFITHGAVIQRAGRSTVA